MEEESKEQEDGGGVAGKLVHVGVGQVFKSEEEDLTNFNFYGNLQVQ